MEIRYLFLSFFNMTLFFKALAFYSNYVTEHVSSVALLEAAKKAVIRNDRFFFLAEILYEYLSYFARKLNNLKVKLRKRWS